MPTQSPWPPHPGSRVLEWAGSGFLPVDLFPLKSVSDTGICSASRPRSLQAGMDLNASQSKRPCPSSASRAAPGSWKRTVSKPPGNSHYSGPPPRAQTIATTFMAE